MAQQVTIHNRNRAWQGANSASDPAQAYRERYRALRRTVIAQRPHATEEEINTAVNLILTREGVTNIGADATYDLIATLRFPLGIPVRPESARSNFYELYRRMMRRVFGPRWTKVVPLGGFSKFAVLESKEHKPHIHALFGIEAAGSLSKARALEDFRDHLEAIWREFVTGGSSWVEPVTSSSDAKRYSAKGLGPHNLDCLIAF